jgi:hypothetical protein
LQASCQDLGLQVRELQGQVEAQEQLLEEREAALIETQDSVQVSEVGGSNGGDVEGRFMS